MPRATIFKVLLAMLLGILAALAAHQLGRNPGQHCQTNCGREAPGPLF